MSTTNEIEFTTYTDVTIVMPAEFLGMTSIYCRELRVRRRPYAQHSEALELRWKAPRQRRERGTVVTVLRNVWILKGNQKGIEGEAFEPCESSVEGVKVSRGRYASCDPRWQTDAAGVIEAAGVEVLDHYYQPH